MKPAAAKLALWRADPVAFVRECFGVEPDAWQARVLRAFPGRQRIAMQACKGPGKSAIKAWLVWNFLATRPHPKVVATSITEDNLRDGLWAELSKWQQKSPFLTRAFTWSAERIVSNEHPETWWASARTWSKTADASQQANTLAGIHAEYVLFVVDEAGGVPDAVVAAAEGGLATGTETKIVIGGNPTHLSGPLYRAATKERALWFRVEITGDPDDPERSPRISEQWAREQIEKYGRDHPWVLVNVFGQFPPGQSNSLIGLDVVEAAMRRTIGEADYVHERRVLGVDVARGGDDRTVIFPRQGRVGFKPRVLRTRDTMDVVGQVSLAATSWKADNILVDGTGVGAGVYDRLAQLGFPVTEVTLGAKALKSPDVPICVNRRAEVWWLMADWVKRGGCLPDVPELVSELTGPTYFHDRTNRLQLESKDDLKARGLPSPDIADALALTFAIPLPPITAAERAGLIERNKCVVEYDPFSEGRL